MKSPTITDHLILLGKIALAALAGILLNYCTHTFFHPGELESDKEILANYLQVVGGIYAVVIGFVIFVVWGQFTESESILEREVGALANLLRTDACLDAEDRLIQIRPYVENYARSVIAEQRYCLTNGGDSPESEKAYHALVDIVRGLSANSHKGAALFSEILRQLEAFTAIRNYRIILLGRRIPWIVWDMLVFASIIMVVPFFFIDVKNPLIDYLIVGSISGAVTFLLSVVYDLDDPFKGVFNISFSIFERLLVEGDDTPA